MTGTSQTGFQIFDFHLKQGSQTAHWKRFKIIRVKHTSDGNIAVSLKRMFDTLFKIGALLVHSPQAID